MNFFFFFLQDYTEYVQEPMDFSTVSEKLDNELYTDPDTFVRDVRLIFSNSRAYNTIPRSRVTTIIILEQILYDCETHGMAMKSRDVTLPRQSGVQRNDLALCDWSLIVYRAVRFTV